MLNQYRVTTLSGQFDLNTYQDEGLEFAEFHLLDNDAVRINVERRRTLHNLWNTPKIKGSYMGDTTPLQTELVGIFLKIASDIQRKPDLFFSNFTHFMAEYSYITYKALETQE